MSEKYSNEDGVRLVAEGYRRLWPGRAPLGRLARGLLLPAARVRRLRDARTRLLEAEFAARDNGGGCGESRE